MKIIITENQYNELVESMGKNKKFIKSLLGDDFISSLKMVQSAHDVPDVFEDGIGSDLINRFLNYWGPMYIFELDGVKYLYQNRSDFEMFLSQDGFDIEEDDMINKLGIDVTGLRFYDIIDMFFEEEEYGL